MVASAQFFFFFKAALLSLMDSSAVLRVPTRTRQQGNNLISLMGCLADSDWPLFPAPSPYVHRRTQTDRGGGGRNTADTPQSVCGCRRSMYHTELPVPHVTCSSAVLAAERRLQRPLLSAPRCSFVFFPAAAGGAAPRRCFSLGPGKLQQLKVKWFLLLQLHQGAGPGHGHM